MGTEAMAELTARYGIRGRVDFREAEGGLIVAEVSNAQATASIALQGAQLLSWTPVGARPVIWVSPAARYLAGQPVRGGVPVCWPWFGPHPTEPAFPAHGFARNQGWELRHTQLLTDGATRLDFHLLQDTGTRALWPHASELELRVTVGRCLRLELITRNTGAAAFTLSQALHTYFAVGDVRQVVVRGLEGLPYIDKVDAGRRVRQEGPVTITAETDRIYLEGAEAGDCLIDDPGLDRRIRIRKRGSRATVVWNPWAEKSAAMADMGEDAYRGMLCVEAANTADDAVTVAPDAEHRLAVDYQLEPL